MARHSYEQVNVPQEILDEICPLTLAQDAISGRWKIVILAHIHKHEVLRFNELLRIIPGVSKGILTRQLRELEEDGLLHREVYKVVPPKVEYSLTARGQAFKPVLQAMHTWGVTILQDLK